MGAASNVCVEDVAKDLLQKCSQSYGLISCKTLQSLWAGYGEICQVRAESNCQPIAFILKHIDPPVTRTNGSLPNEGHIRKILSYQIEQFFYTQLAPQMPKEIAIASCVASASHGSGSNSTAMLLTNLRVEYPVAGEKRAELSERQTYAALEWLANFHGFWWSKVEEMDKSKLCLPPLEHFAKHGSTALGDPQVWLHGGYT